MQLKPVVCLLSTASQTTSCLSPALINPALPQCGDVTSRHTDTRHPSACTHTHTCTHKRAYTHTHTCTHPHKYIDTHSHTRTHTQTHTHTHLYMHTHMLAHRHRDTHTHTQTHIHPHTLEYTLGYQGCLYRMSLSTCLSTDLISLI